MSTVDILMATCNGERFVREQIESVQAQTFSDWRLVVSDDCSTDGTLDIVREMAVADPRIAIESEGVRHGSAKGNFMSLLSAAEARYAMFCDQDDVWLPSKVEQTLGRMRRLEREHGGDVPLLVFTDMRVVDEELNVIHESFERYSHIDPQRTRFPHLLAQSVGAGCTMMVNRRAVELALRATDSGGMIMHDWWLSLICSAFGEIGYIDEPTTLYRQHGENEVGAEGFDAFSWVGRIDEMVERQRRISAQAGHFADIYGAILDGELLAQARECSSICSGGALQNLGSLARSGAWKAGARKLGQVVAASKARGGVIAVIVTFNPDMERLEQNISAIESQVDMLVVYDNASGDAAELEGLLAAKGCVYHLSTENVGLAVALNDACAVADALGASDVVLLDQDSVAGEGMVAGLRALLDGNVVLVSPQIVDRNKREGFVPGGVPHPIKRAITSGALVSLRAWKNVGGYDERLFVDWVDYDFCANLRAHGYWLMRNDAVMLLHEMGRREYALTLPTPRGGRPLYRSNHPLNRQRDKARSWAIVGSKYGSSRVGREERRYIASIAARDIMLERRRLKVASAFVAGMREGRAVVHVTSGDGPDV